MAEDVGLHDELDITVPVEVNRVVIFPGSTIGQGFGTYEGREVSFYGDWRPMATIGAALDVDGGPVTAYVPLHQVL